MAFHPPAAVAAEPPPGNIGTDIHRATNTQEAPKSQETRGEELPKNFETQTDKASLYHGMQQWQNKLNLVTHAWVHDDIKEPIERFIHEPGLPAYYRMVALLARCFPEPEPESNDGGEMEEATETEIDEDRKYFMAEAKKSYEECLVVYTRPWDLESVEEAWSTWPN